MIDLSTYGFNHRATTWWGCYVIDIYENKNKNCTIRVNVSANSFDVIKDGTILMQDEPVIKLSETAAKLSAHVK